MYIHVQEKLGISLGKSQLVMLFYRVLVRTNHPQDSVEGSQQLFQNMSRIWALLYDAHVLPPQASAHAHDMHVQTIQVGYTYM